MMDKYGWPDADNLLLTWEQKWWQRRQEPIDGWIAPEVCICQCIKWSEKTDFVFLPVPSQDMRMHFCFPAVVQQSTVTFLLTLQVTTKVLHPDLNINHICIFFVEVRIFKGIFPLIRYNTKTYIQYPNKEHGFTYNGSEFLINTWWMYT